MKREIIYKELSYKINGLCFKTQYELGRFCREKQYADKLENLLKVNQVKFKREIELVKLKNDAIRGNRIDFIIEDKIILDVKAKKIYNKR